MVDHLQMPRESGWQAAHAKKYIETNGEQGHRWNGQLSLLLTTIGNRSGLPYTTPLFYGMDGERYLVVASNGGARKHPQWYRNLVTSPKVGIQVGAEKFDATARPASPEEKPALWQKMLSIFPSYAGMQEKTDRDIPVVIIERI